MEEKAFSISGLKKEMDVVTENLNIIGQDTVGCHVTSYAFDVLLTAVGTSVEIQKLSLQDSFIRMVGHKGSKDHTCCFSDRQAGVFKQQN